jgi:hypothetical protein
MTQKQLCVGSNIPQNVIEIEIFPFFARLTAIETPSSRAKRPHQVKVLNDKTLVN